MSDIYQRIWDADQAGSGIPAILDTEQGDPGRGFVQVNSNLGASAPDLRVLPDAVIPADKRRTYDHCLSLFDNFALPERDEENETPDEREEIHDLVHAIVDTPPMEVAREYVVTATGTSLTRERWYNTILEMWFRRFAMGGDPHLTGFEHVVVGEQEGAKAQGYHFWYKYYLDDGFARTVDGTHHDFPGLSQDRITYLGSRQSGDQHQHPECVTISYRWDAPDYHREAIRPLTKPTGGFFVGCSVEGLLALGTVRAHLAARAPKEAVINGAKYSMKVYRSPNGRHVRTFYPMFLGSHGPLPDDDDDNDDDVAVSTAPVRIIAALVNPEGHDPGLESVTLINTGSGDQRLDDWRLVDKNDRSATLPSGTLEAGNTTRIRLDETGPQLSNKGGRIDLLDDQGRRVHGVTYSKGQARDEGMTVVF